MDTGIAAVVIACLALLLNVIIAVRNSQWGLPDRLKEMETRIMAAVQQHKSAIDVAMDKLRADTTETTDTMRHDFGETAAAIREKVSEFEKWSRDNFVRETHFADVMRETREAMRANAKERDMRLDRIDASIERLTEHLLKG